MKAVSPTTLALLLLLLTLGHQAAPVNASRGYNRCNPLTAQQKTCMRGCLSCWKTYGGDVYDMASCCQDCTFQKALLVDFAPTRCGHVQKNWLKRFG